MKDMQKKITREFSRSKKRNYELDTPYLTHYLFIF